MRFIAIITWSIVALLLGLAPAVAEQRVALVIGNGAYVRVKALDNPIIDARAMRDVLSRLEFKVVYGENLDKSGMERRISDFATMVADADVAIVYYAGHGSTFGDIPYVVPVDAAYDQLERIPYELIQVETLMGELRRAKGVRIAILDACRDNERELDLKRKAVRGGTPSRGLGRINTGGLIVAYATQHLTTAEDGPRGANSPFTSALTRHIATPGLDVKSMFFKVAQEVIQKTGGTQRPEISFSLYEDYVLVRGTPSTATPVPPSPPAAIDRDAAARRDYELAALVGTKAAWEAFLARHPSGYYAELARGQLGKLALVAPPVAPVQPPTIVQPTVGVSPPPTIRVDALTPARERALKPKDTFKECDACPEMVVVPAGSFTMGAPESEPGSHNFERPQHQVTFAQQFAVGRFAVTFDEWDACVADGGCNGYKPNDQNWGRGRQPAVNVSWNDAQAYAAWLSRKTGKKYRLLSGAQREYVSRAGTTTPFWWSSSISTQQANYDGGKVYQNGSKGMDRNKTMPVDSF